MAGGGGDMMMKDKLGEMEFLPHYHDMHYSEEDGAGGRGGGGGGRVNMVAKDKLGETELLSQVARYAKR